LSVSNDIREFIQMLPAGVDLVSIRRTSKTR
jgi:hypothetical protein